MIDLPVGRGRPTDERQFIHKKILGVVSRVASVGASVGIPGAGAVSTISRTLAGSRRSVPRTQLTRGITQTSQMEKRLAAAAKGLGGASLSAFGGLPCIWPWTMFEGKCVPPFIGDQPGRDDQPVGEAVMGRYGAGLRPGSMLIDRAICLKGMQLGNDGICYNKSQISNKQRQWPAGRKPLLSGGDMRAISIAARAGRRLEGATKRLQRLGMMKKPTSSRRSISARPHPALLVESNVKH